MILFLLAPLTNFVKSYQKDSNLINNIAYITIMGGTKSKGNIKFNQKAKYNIYKDADSIDIVFISGIKIDVFGRCNSFIKIFR